MHFRYKLSYYAKTIVPPLWYLAFFAFLLWYSVSRLYPGIHNGTTLMQLKEATDPSASFSSWNPPLLTLIWKILISVSGQNCSIMIFNASLLWLGLILSVTAIVRSIFFSSLIILLLGFSSFYLPYLAYYHKDIPFGASLLLASGFLLQARVSGRNLLAIPAVFFIFLACSIRHNGSFAVLPVGITFVYYLKEHYSFLRRATFIKGILFFVLIFTLSFATNKILARQQTKRDYTRYPAQMLLLFDVVGTSVFADKMLVPQFYQERKNPRSNDLNYLKERYSSSSATSLLWFKNKIGLLTNKRQMRELFSAWVMAVTHYPAAYMRHRWKYYEGFLFSNFSSIEGSLFTISNSKYARGELQPFEYAMFRNYYQPRHGILSNRIIFLILYFLLVFWFIKRKFHDEPVVIAMTFSGLFYMLSYLIVGVGIHSKYTWWCAISLPIILLYVYSQYTSMILNFLNRSHLGNKINSFGKKTTPTPPTI